MRQHWPRAAMLDWSCAAPTQDIVAPAVAASHGEMWGSRVAAPALTHACWSSRPRARPARERERFDERNASQPARRATTTTLPLQTLPESGTPGNRGGRMFSGYTFALQFHLQWPSLTFSLFYSNYGARITCHGHLWQSSHGSSSGKCVSTRDVERCAGGLVGWPPARTTAIATHARRRGDYGATRALPIRTASDDSRIAAPRPPA